MKVILEFISGHHTSSDQSWVTEVKLSYRDPLSGSMVWYSHNGSNNVSNGLNTMYEHRGEIFCLFSVIFFFYFLFFFIFFFWWGFQRCVPARIQKVLLLVIPFKSPRKFCQSGYNFYNVFFLVYEGGSQCQYKQAIIGVSLTCR